MATIHFESENELKDRTVHDQCATNVESLRKARKQFFLRLKDAPNKSRKTDQVRVWLNFVLLLSKFISKREFSTTM